MTNWCQHSRQSLSVWVANYERSSLGGHPYNCEWSNKYWAERRVRCISGMINYPYSEVHLSCDVHEKENMVYWSFVCWRIRTNYLILFHSSNWGPYVNIILINIFPQKLLDIGALQMWGTLLMDPTTSFGQIIVTFLANFWVATKAIDQSAL
jgi:hypothetical protein